MNATTKARIRIPLERRPGNALNVEIGQPADRCIQKRPHHWPTPVTAIRWLASGGDALVFGCCCPPCPLDDGRGEQTPAGGGTSAPNPPCTPPSPCEMCNGVGFYVSLPGDVITPCPGCSQDRKQECPTCGGDPYVQPCEDCGATGHEGDD